MKKTYVLNLIALIIAFFVGGVMLPIFTTNLHAEVDGAPKKYTVQLNYARADLEPQLNKLTAQGYKFVQAVPDNEGVDIIFSK
jgi:hypothetical protein